MKSATLVLAALLPACASSADDRPSPAPAPEAAAHDASAPEGFAPTPFTAGQIREGCAPGTVTVQRIEAEGRPVILQTTHFFREDGERVWLRATTTTEDGQPAGPPQEIEATWAELRDHALFPAAATTRSEATCTIAAGTIDCLLYTVDRSTADARIVDRLYFDPANPGPPVLFESEHDGRTVLRLELVERRRDEG